MSNNDYRDSRENKNQNNNVVRKEILKLDSKTYVRQAEKVIKSLKNENKKNISSNQLRNILILFNEVNYIIQHETDKKLSDDLQSRTQYIKMRIAYNAGKEPSVRKFINDSKIMDYLDLVGESRDELVLVCKYMESLVAYHKFYNL